MRLAKSGSTAYQLEQCDANIAALDRFVSRQGLPSKIHSDNGSNFVGTAAELKKFFENLGNRGAISTRYICCRLLISKMDCDSIVVTVPRPDTIRKMSLKLQKLPYVTSRQLSRKPKFSIKSRYRPYRLHNLIRDFREILRRQIQSRSYDASRSILLITAIADE